jgi:glutathione S-transferase
MLTLFHAPQSRSSAVMVLIEEMGLADKITIHETDIPRIDGSGARDPANPHPEGKVPCLVHDGTVITERGAIMLYLTALFPESGLAPKPGTARRGEYLTWLFWYGSVMEPVLILDWEGITSAGIAASLRGKAEIHARLHAALEKGPWLLGEEYSAADILCHAPFSFYPPSLPDDPLIRDWVARCQTRAAVDRVKARDMAAMAARTAA